MIRNNTVLLFIALSVLPILAQADEVVLQDGSRIVGTVVKIQDGTMTLQTAHVGKLSISMASVAGVTTDSTHGVSLDNETAEQGQLTYDGSKQVFMQGNEAKPVDVEPAELLLLWPEGEDMPKPARQWAGRVQLGITGADGNSDRFSFLGLTDATRTREQDTLFLYFQGAFAEDSGVRSRNEFKTGGRYEWNFTEKWSAYFRTEFEEDEFESIDLRTTAVLGMGRKLLNKPKQTLSTRFGLGYLREDFEDAETEDEAIFDFGYDYALQIREIAKFTHNLTYYSALEDPIENFRMVINTGTDIPLSNTEQWKLRLGVTHEYDDEPVEGIDRLDTTYYMNLVYDW